MTETRAGVKLDVRVHPIENPKGDTRAFASVAINDLIAIRGVRVIEDKKGLFVAMPRSYDAKTGKHHDIAFPMTGTLRRDITKAVLDENKQQLALPAQERGYKKPEAAVDVDKEMESVKNMEIAENVKLDIRVFPIDDPQGSTKAFASISVDGLISIRSARVVEGDEGLFVAMPHTQDKYLNYHDVAFPLTRELRDVISEKVIDKFENPEKSLDRKQSLADKLADGANKASQHTAPQRVAAKSHAGALE